MVKQTLILSLSGPSSSGKTTLARLLRAILTHPSSSSDQQSISSFILHEDDFYVTDADIPIDSASGLQDWDCAEAIDVPALISALRFIKENGRSPDELVSKEDQNEAGDSGVGESTVAEIGERVRGRLHEILHRRDGGMDTITIAIVDGFLLYAPPASDSPFAPVLELLDVKLFLRTTYEKMKERRERRKGYVTLEGFWEDPPGYVDKIVWPNYVRDHEWMFEGENVDKGDVRSEVGKLGIQVALGKGDTDIEGLLQWAVKVLEDETDKYFKRND